MAISAEDSNHQKMGTDGERAALVSGHNLYTEEGVRGEELSPPPVEETAEPYNILSQFHHDALTQIGMGSYQWLLGIASGFCFMADGVQVFLLPYLAPSIQAEMCLEDSRVPWLNGVTMFGLFFGAIFCSLGDHVGRRSLLLFALALHLLFNVGTAFAPTFGVFMTSRFGSSIGLGMCFPIACVYFAEFLPQNARGNLSGLLSFWAVGGIYVAFLANSFLPASGEEIVRELNEHQSSWHTVLLLSSLPAAFAFVALCCSPESVRYLLHAGRDVNAIVIYQQMYKCNASKSAQYQLTELELPTKVVISKPPPSKSVWDQMSYNIGQYFDALKQLGMQQQFKTLLLLSISWAALGFSYYGMSDWFPSHIQNLKDIQYYGDVKVIKDKYQFRKEYNGRLENQIFKNMTFDTCLFAHIVLSHVTFENCILNYTDFSVVHSSKTYFINSIIENSRIYDSDFTPDRFINSSQFNVTYLSPKPSCYSDVDFRLTQTNKLRENFLRAMAPFIALIIHGVSLQSFPKKNIGSTSMLICGITLNLVWILFDEIPLLLFDFNWSIVFLCAFNAVNTITVEAFPVHLRTTGFGICFGWFRLFGLLSTCISSISTVIFSFAFLLSGSMALLKLHDTSFNLM